MTENRELWARYLRMRGWTVDESVTNGWMWRDPQDMPIADALHLSTGFWQIGAAMQIEAMRHLSEHPEELLGPWMREQERMRGSSVAQEVTESCATTDAWRGKR